MTRFTTRPLLQGTFGMIASTHWLASAVGMRMLEIGGNAFDAAAAAGFVLHVVEPHLNGPGGDMPALIWDAAEGKVSVLCGQGPAPAAATIEAFQGLGLAMVPGDGLLATCVPGAVDAWLLLLRDKGTLTLRQILEPAIGYAEQGHPILPRVVDTIAGCQERFTQHWPTSAASWLPGGAPPVPETLFAMPTLAQTWRRLLAEAESTGHGREGQIEAARRAWGRGFVAEAIDRFCREQEIMDGSGRAHRGLLTGADMAAFQAHLEAPLAVDYRGITLYKTGTWGQGPVFLQLLKLLEGFDLDAMPADGPDFVHTVLEALKLVFADREAFYGDPKFGDVPVETLLSAAYAAERRKAIAAEASLAFRPGAIAGFERQRELALAGYDEATGRGGPAGEPTFGHLAERKGKGDTCHVDVVDRFGNMISATPSGGWLQSSPTIPELGFCLGSRAQMFRLDPARPDALAPGKRPRTTLSPSMALRDGKPWLAFGTPGGDQQDQWQPLMLLRHMHHGMNLQEAIDAPLFHSEHHPLSFYPRQAKPGAVQIEASFPEATIRELERRGHRLTVQPAWSIGRLTGVAQQGGILSAAATPRQMQAYAIGR